MYRYIKIAQVVSTFPPYHGGMGNVAYQIADKLSALKYQVTVFTPKHSFFEDDLVSFFRIDKLRPLFKYGNAALVIQLLWRLWPYNIVHLHYPFLGAGIQTVIWKFFKQKKGRLVVHYHMDLVGRGWRRFVYRLYNFIVLPLIVRTADNILVTSADYLEQSLLKKYTAKFTHKIAVVPNGVDVDFFKPQPSDAGLRERHYLNGKKIILFVGALDSAHYFKGVNYLLKAVQLLNRQDMKLIIVGDGDLKEVYQDLAQSYGIFDQIIFAGYVPDGELIKYYNLCDIFILPSIDKSEAFGLVLLEAMACGKPVIATNLPGVRQVVSSKIDGRLARPKDAWHLSEHIKFFLDHPEAIDRYGEMGRKKVLETYSWDIVIKSIITLYQLQ